MNSFMLRLAKCLIILAIIMTVDIDGADAQIVMPPQDPNATFQMIQIQQQQLLMQQAAQQQALIDKVKADQEAQQRAAQNQGLVSLATAMCSQLFGGSASTQTAMSSTGTNLEDTAYEMDTLAYESMEKQGFVDAPGMDQKFVRDIGMDASATLQKGCSNFINAEGKLGPWGVYSLSLIQGKPESFGNNVPDDITKWCPRYPKMNKEQRDMYWVWILMSMASSESSCDPSQDNPNAPNGTAKGLFQVWKPVCPKARNLSRANENIQCAVDLLAKEMQNRDTLMTPTSKGSEGTYWGPLRSDDWNKRRGGDIAGARKTRGIMAKYRYCH